MFAKEHSLLYNGNKLYSLCFKPKVIQFEKPDFFLDRMIVPSVCKCRHLGITISEKQCDLDIKRQIRKLYDNANMLMRKFSKCSYDVKCYLCKSYCSNLYCASLWYDSTKTARES